MFGADIAYMDSCIDEEYGTDSLLPEYLYPAFRVANPWHRHTNKTQLESDIIIIAEFSELEGPKPVITIPNDREIHFDINDFTVRIMSVDQGSSGQQGFNMPEDSQVMMSDTKENVYAFVHHFVLLDKQARGYSRPFAMSYVTPDQRKLLNFYEEISTNFRKIARFLKYGNKLVFKNDLDKFMMDLQYTKDQMVNRFRSTIQPGQTDLDNKLLQSLKTLESQISEIQEILNQLNTTLTDKRLEQRFSKIEERVQINKGRPKSESLSLQDWESIESPESAHFASLGSVTDTDNLLFFDVHHYKPKLVEISKGRKFDLHLRGLHELCSWGAKEGLQKLRQIYQYFQQDISVLQMEKKDLSLLSPASGIVTFGNKVLAANFMTNIDKICISSCCLLNVPGTRSNYETWSMLGRSWSSNDTLSSFKSVPSSFQSLCDDDDTDSMLSATSDLEIYMRRANSLGSFQLIGPGSFDSNSIGTPPMDGFILDSSHSSLQEDYSVLHNKMERTLTVSESNHIRNSGLSDEMTEQLQNEDMESTLKKSEEINIDCSNGIIDGDKGLEESEINSLKTSSDHSQISDYESDDENGSTRDRSKTLINKRHSKNLENVILKDNDTCNLCNNHTRNENIDTEDEKADGSISIENLGNIHVISEGHLKCQTYTGDVDSSSGVSSCDKQHLDLSQNLKSDEDTMKQNLHKEESKTESETNKADMFRFDTYNDVISSGLGIIKVLQTYSNIQNVIYSLLIGRPVVIIGAAIHEEEIKEIVTALKIFFPGCHRYPRGCTLWTTKGLSITDIPDIKLIGICRHEKKSVDRMIPKSVQSLITLFDVERRTIKSPVYQGSLITTILSRKKSFKTEDGYINFIKVLLCEFSTKAFIYFHSFCLGTVGTVTSDKHTVICESDSTQRTTTNFLSKLGIQDCDVNIIEYLTELVKYQHIEDHYKSLNPTGVPPRAVSKNKQSCQLFKC